MKKISIATIIITIISIAWTILTIIIAKQLLEKGSVIEASDYFLVPLFIFGPLIVSLILWIKVIKEHKYDKKNGFCDSNVIYSIKKTLLILFIDICMFVIGLLVTFYIINLPKNNFATWLVLRIFVYYLFYWGMNFLLYLSYRYERKMPSLLVFFVSISYLLLSLLGKKYFDGIVSDLIEFNKIDTNSNVIINFIVLIPIFANVTTLLACHIKYKEELNDKWFILIFLLGPVVGIFIPIYLLVKFFASSAEYHKGAVEINSYSIDGTEVYKTNYLTNGYETYKDSFGNEYVSKDGKEYYKVE